MTIHLGESLIKLNELHANRHACSSQQAAQRVSNNASLTVMHGELDDERRAKLGETPALNGEVWNKLRKESQDMDMPGCLLGGPACRWWCDTSKAIVHLSLVVQASVCGNSVF
jgi:hypothetical protein